MSISPYEHILESQQFSDEYISNLFKLTSHFKKKSSNNYLNLKDKIVGMLFYEASTRTRFSFESAVLRLGGKVMMTENAKEFSSAVKGETLEDTIRVMSGYCDMLVMRHFENDAAQRAAKISKVPIINAGSGTGQHPTQALLDLYTIYEKFDRKDNLKIALVGDLCRGRTVNSLVYLLSKFKGNEFYLVSPENCKIKQGIKDHLVENDISFIETDNLDATLANADVVYMTRIQKERFGDDLTGYEKAKGKFILHENISLMKENAIIMHPLPRVDEIHPDVDNDKRARYFEQAQNGLYVRMALLTLLNNVLK